MYNDSQYPRDIVNILHIHESRTHEYIHAHTGGWTKRNRERETQVTKTNKTATHIQSDALYYMENFIATIRIGQRTATTHTHTYISSIFTYTHPWIHKHEHTHTHMP